MSYRLVVIGSGPAGVSAATSYLGAGGEGPVLLVSRDAHAPYERPPLSKEALREPGGIERSAFVTDKELGDVEVRLDTAVTGLDLESRTLTMGEDTETYDNLVIAAGMTPLPLPGADEDAEVHLLRSLADAQALKQSASHARTALVIGSGFIGCEAAVSLARLGLDVTLVSREEGPQANRLGAYAAGVITDWMTAEGVTVMPGVGVTSVHAPRRVHLDNGQTIEPDLVLAALGVSPATDFIEGTGLQTHEGRLVVDEHLRTDDEHVWAAGDAARAMNASAGRTLSVEHWGDALTMGEVAGRNAAGGEETWDAVPGFWSQIGDHWLQYSAWGDGYDTSEVVERTGGFTVWYGRDKEVVGVLAVNADNDYERGGQLIGERADFHAAVHGATPSATEAGEGADEED